jgi:hypothetical protein
MAEDAEFVRALEGRRPHVHRPCSFTQTAAGAKDEGEAHAIENDVSVTPA